MGLKDREKMLNQFDEKIEKHLIHYHTPKLVVRFKSGKSVALIDSQDDMVDDFIRVSF